MLEVNGITKKEEILIIGAGACGLMTARELSKAGKKVAILEARDRIGGRIWPLDEKEFGYPAQGGAEFVHGEAPITKSLAKEARMTLIQTQGDMWNARNGELIINNDFVPHPEAFHQNLKALTEDMPLMDFLNKYCADEEYKILRDDIIKMAEGYDAADSKRISTFSLRDEWLSGKDWLQKDWLQYRIKEGYGALLNFLKSECEKNNVKIYLKKQVELVDGRGRIIKIKCADGAIYEGNRVVVTVPLPIIKNITFIPAIPEKLDAVSKIGFGGAVKLILKFKDRWWADALAKDFSEMHFILSPDIFSAWWTQYPDLTPVLTGWLAGPKSQEFVNLSPEEILKIGLASLSDIFKVTEEFLRERLILWKANNWPADPFALGAYSYPTPETKEALAELAKPVDNKIFFAGEALCKGKETATVEGALASGKEVAEKILI